MDDRLARVALAWTSGVGPKAYAALLERFGDAQSVLDAAADEMKEAAPRLRTVAAEAVTQAADQLPQIEEELERLADEDVAVWCLGDEGYPPRLARIPNPSPVLCCRGAIIAEDDLALAIVGTRTPTEEGEQVAREIATAVAAEGVTVVSGLALGCDAAAHRGALEGGGRTIAVFGSGIQVVHPPENHELAVEILDSGAHLSELPPRARANTGRLMARNRLQSGLSCGVLVVEARLQGGSLETARVTQRQERLLCAIDWPDKKEEAVGTRQMIAGGAMRVRGVEDVPEMLEALRAWEPPPVEPEQMHLF